MVFSYEEWVAIMEKDPKKFTTFEVTENLLDGSKRLKIKTKDGMEMRIKLPKVAKIESKGIFDTDFWKMILPLLPLLPSLLSGTRIEEMLGGREHVERIIQLLREGEILRALSHLAGVFIGKSLRTDNSDSLSSVAQLLSQVGNTSKEERTLPVLRRTPLKHDVIIEVPVVEVKLEPMEDLILEETLNQSEPNPLPLSGLMGLLSSFMGNSEKKVKETPLLEALGSIDHQRFGEAMNFLQNLEPKNGSMTEMIQDIGNKLKESGILDKDE